MLGINFAEAGSQQIRKGSGCCPFLPVPLTGGQAYPTDGCKQEGNPGGEVVTDGFFGQISPWRLHVLIENSRYFEAVPAQLNQCRDCAMRIGLDPDTFCEPC